MRGHRGMVTLLLTSVWLLVALLIAFGSYKGVLYQVKRARNDVEDRQNHWAAEGGLECIYAQAKLLNAIPSDVSQCQALLGLSRLSITAGSPNLVFSSAHNLTLSKAISSPIHVHSGAIRAMSNVIINGSFTAAPDPGKSLGNNLWQCISVRYSHQFYATRYDTYHPYQTSKPYASFPDSVFPNYQRCSSAYHSVGARDLTDTAGDYAQDSAMDPFQEVFDVARSEWFDVMSDTRLFGYVPFDLNSRKFSNVAALGPPEFNHQCTEQIIQNIQQGRDTIWVYGGCELNRDDVDALNRAIDHHLNSGIILVVHNGLLSITGSQSLKAMLYHFLSDGFTHNHGRGAAFTNWDQTENGKPVNGMASRLDDVINSMSGNITMSKSKVGYFQNGAFNPSGGYVLDGPDTLALFNQSLVFTYNREIIDRPLKKFRSPSWYRGSWHDF